jgi:hypothetical protein
VPLFYYLLHILVIHILAGVFAYFKYGWEKLNTFVARPPDWGYDLWVVYMVWIGVVLLLYWPCRGWAVLKRRHPGGILSYL